MKLLNALAGSMVAAALVAAPVAFSAEPMAKHDMSAMKQDKDGFMKSCDMDHDGMMSRAEMHAHMDRLYREKFGPEDYARIQEVRAWLEDNERRWMLLAFLQSEDPYKP